MPIAIHHIETLVPAPSYSQEDGGQVFSPFDLSSVADMDQEAFGASRARLLQKIAEMSPGGSLVQKTGGDVRGYACSRPGTRGHHLGPVVARDDDAAQSLLDGILRRLGEGSRDARRQTRDVPKDPPSVVLDVLLANGFLAEIARTRFGFEEKRRLVRMYRGEPPSRGRPDWIYAIAGPEKG